MWCDWGLILLTALFLPTLTTADDSEENRKESIATNNPRFLSRGGVRELREGESSELECLVEDLGEFVVLWKLNRTHVLFAGNLRINRDKRYSITNQALTIRDIQSDISGEYSCQISTNPPREIVYVIKVLYTNHEPILNQSINESVYESVNENIINGVTVTVTPGNGCRDRWSPFVLTVLAAITALSFSVWRQLARDVQ